MSSSSNNINNNNNKYGSLPDIYTNNSDDIEGEEHGTYPIENTQYIVSTAEERRRKCVNACIPVMAFVVLMSGIAFALSRDFNHLYPAGRGGNPSSSSKTSDNDGASKHSWVSEDVETTTTPESTVHVSSKPTSGTINIVKEVQNAKVEDNSHADCSFHNMCIAANLTGICCPTPEDVLLDCCN
jgi:hypothetical protein